MQGGIGASASKDTEAGQKYSAWALVEVDEGSVRFDLLGGSQSLSVRHRGSIGILGGLDYPKPSFGDSIRFKPIFAPSASGSGFCVLNHFRYVSFYFSLF